MNRYFAVKAFKYIFRDVRIQHVSPVGSFSLSIASACDMDPQFAICWMIIKGLTSESGLDSPWKTTRGTGTRVICAIKLAVAAS